MRYRIQYYLIAVFSLGLFFSCDKKHFDDQDWSSIHNIQVPQPLFLEDYIQSIYGNDWRVPNNDWQVSDYKNII